jgi:replication factor A1
MNNNDVADIQATLKNIGVEATPEQIQNKLDALARFKVIGSEAKRNTIRSLAKAAGVDASAAFKGSSAPVRIADIKEDGKWVSLKVKVVQLWDPTSDKITQTGLIGDETGIIKFTTWKTSELSPLEEGKSYEIKSAVTNLFNDRFQIKLNKNTTFSELAEDVTVVQQTEDFIGAIVNIQSCSGLIKRCPECNRQTKAGQCTVHGRVEGTFDLRIKAVIDNGIEIRELLLDADLTHQITGIDLAKAKEMAAEALDQGVVSTTIKDLIMGRYFQVTGNNTGRYLIVKKAALAAMALNADEIVAAVEAV